jgi:hypothetical protein
MDATKLHLQLQLSANQRLTINWRQLQMGLNSTVLKQLGKLGVAPIKEWKAPPLFSTGSLLADYAFGGGVERGRMGLFVGESYYGKTTLAYLIAANVLRNKETMVNGGRVAFFDMERRYNAEYAQSLGLDDEGVDMFQPLTGEQLLDSLSIILEAKAYDLIIVDSIAKTGFTTEIGASASDSSVGLAARRWGAWSRGNTGRLAMSNSFIYFINRPSPKIPGPGDTYYGGRWQVFDSDICARLNKPDKSTKGVLKLRPKAFKNSRTGDMRIPPEDVEVNLIMSAAKPFVDPVPELVQLGATLGVFTKEDGTEIAGNCGYFYKGGKIGSGSGSPAVKAVLYEDSDLRFEIEDRVREAMLYKFHPHLAAEAKGTNIKTGEVPRENDYYGEELDDLLPVHEEDSEE